MPPGDHNDFLKKLGVQPVEVGGVAEQTIVAVSIVGSAYAEPGQPVEPAAVSVDLQPVALAFVQEVAVETAAIAPPREAVASPPARERHAAAQEPIPAIDFDGRAAVLAAAPLALAVARRERVKNNWRRRFVVDPALDQDAEFVIRVNAAE